MSLKKSIDNDGVLTISVSGFFDCSFADSFEGLHSDLAPPVEKCVIDLTDADYINSVAVGQLIELHKAANNNGVEITFVISGLIKQIFDTMSLENIFKNIEVK